MQAVAINNLSLFHFDNSRCGSKQKGNRFDSLAWTAALYDDVIIKVSTCRLLMHLKREGTKK